MDRRARLVNEFIRRRTEDGDIIITFNDDNINSLSYLEVTQSWTGGLDW